MDTSDRSFKINQLKKRKEFHELIHAAFILETSVSFYFKRPPPTADNLSWLAGAYPHSLIENGNDQGRNYTTITPML